jgi:hypothetical protein
LLASVAGSARRNLVIAPVLAVELVVGSVEVVGVLIGGARRPLLLGTPVGLLSTLLLALAAGGSTLRALTLRALTLRVSSLRALSVLNLLLRVRVVRIAASAATATTTPASTAALASLTRGALAMETLDLWGSITRRRFARRLR